MNPKPQATGPWPPTPDHRSLITGHWPLATCCHLLLVLMVLLPAAARAQPARTNPVAEEPASLAASPLPGYAGSVSCRECHEKFYALWSTSFHGLAMQPYTAELAKTKLTAQTNEVAAGPYRFRVDLQRSEVIERTATHETRYPIVQAMGGKNVFYFLTPLERGWLQVLRTARSLSRHCCGNRSRRSRSSLPRTESTRP